jgi:hypothetical protein
MDVGDGDPSWVDSWVEYFPNAVVISLVRDRSRLRYEKRLWSLHLDPGNADRLRQFALEYESYCSFIRLTDPTDAAVVTLLRCLTPTGVLVVESGGQFALFSH